MSSLLLRGGLVIDPVHHDAGQRRDLAVRDGRIVAPAARKKSSTRRSMPAAAW